LRISVILKNQGFHNFEWKKMPKCFKKLRNLSYLKNGRHFENFRHFEKSIFWWFWMKEGTKTFPKRINMSKLIEILRNFSSLKNGRHFKNIRHFEKSYFCQFWLKKTKSKSIYMLKFVDKWRIQPKRCWVWRSVLCNWIHSEKPKKSTSAPSAITPPFWLFFKIGKKHFF
jgi:hypothetical protein